MMIAQYKMSYFKKKVKISTKEDIQAKKLQPKFNAVGKCYIWRVRLVYKVTYIIMVVSFKMLKNNIGPHYKQLKL
jgi:hypothetical protein